MAAPILLLIALPICPPQSESYNEFAATVIRPRYEKLSRGLQYDRIDILDNTPELTRWLRLGDRVAVLAYPQDSIASTFGNQPVLEQAFMQHRLLNEQYLATVRFVEPNAPAALDSVSPSSNLRLDGILGYSEYLTRLPLHELGTTKNPAVTIEEFGDLAPAKKRLRLRIRRRDIPFDEHATLILDAKLGRCLEAHYPAPNGKPSRTAHFHYEPSGQEIGIATEVITELYPLPEYEQEATQERILIGNVRLGASLTDNRFRLTHYGLPEPDFAKRGGWPMWAWFLIIGGVLIVTGKLVSRSRWSPA